MQAFFFFVVEFPLQQFFQNGSGFPLSMTTPRGDLWEHFFAQAFSSGAVQCELRWAFLQSLFDAHSAGIQFVGHTVPRSEKNLASGLCVRGYTDFEVQIPTDMNQCIGKDVQETAQQFDGIRCRLMTQNVKFRFSSARVSRSVEPYWQYRYCSGLRNLSPDNGREIRQSH